MSPSRPCRLKIKTVEPLTPSPRTAGFSLPPDITDALVAEAGRRIILLEPLRRDVDGTGSGVKFKGQVTLNDQSEPCVQPRSLFHKPMPYRQTPRVTRAEGKGPEKGE